MFTNKGEADCRMTVCLLFAYQWSVFRKNYIEECGDIEYNEQDRSVRKGKL